MLSILIVGLGIVSYGLKLVNKTKFPHLGGQSIVGKTDGFSKTLPYNTISALCRTTGQPHSVVCSYLDRYGVAGMEIMKAEQGRGL